MKEERKYKMLIVDDEPIISDGLKDLFEENFGDVFQVYNCYHPKKALEIFKYRLPDVVVSDVKMPKMTGMEMAEEMRKIKQDLHVLFLSGYDEFDYVYSAIKQDADDYILKTEGDDTILAAMKKMIELLDAENVFMEEYKSAQSKISYMAPAFKQKAMVNILDGDISTREEFEAMMTDLENPMPFDAHFLMLIGVTQERVTQATQEKILETVDQILMKAYEGKIRHVHKVIYRKSFVWLLETEESELPGLLFVTVLDVQKMIQFRLNMLMSFVIAREGVLWNTLSLKYDDLWAEMQRQSVNSENSIIMESRENGISDSFNGEESDFEQMVVPITEKLNVMEGLLKGENLEAYMEELEDILKTLSKAKRHSMYALEIYYSIANMLITFINKHNIRPQLASRIQLMELFDPGSFVTWEQAAEYIHRLTGTIQEICRISSQNTITGITEKTKSYILSNLGSDLSLTAIGQEIGFNPIYLSRVFKQTEGTSIREYIENCRMEMAKRLIVNSRMKIYEIAEKCGYQNTAYFIKIFKAHFGMTPQECRDRE
ncbi:MAG: response regulator [Eubacteriales bacterium]|nr:response regulator [Eubacteriales bacterium]